MDVLPKIHVIELAELDAVSGIYFLMRKEEVLYVGQSVNVPQRVFQHKNAGQIPFSYALWYEVPLPDLDHVEYYWISILQPQFNNGNKGVLRLPYYYATGILTSALIEKIQQVHQQISQELTNCYKEVLARAEQPSTRALVQHIMDLRQDLYDGLRELGLPITAAQKLVERFFGWHAWRTSMSLNGKKEPNEKKRLERKAKVIATKHYITR